VEEINGEGVWVYMHLSTVATKYTCLKFLALFTLLLSTSNQLAKLISYKFTGYGNILLMEISFVCFSAG